MGAEQSLIGGRKRSRSVDSNDNKTFEAYKAVKSILEEQGKDFEKQVFLDLCSILGVMLEPRGAPKGRD